MKQDDSNRLLPKDGNEPRYRAYSDEEEQKRELRSQQEYAAGYGGDRMFLILKAFVVMM